MKRASTILVALFVASIELAFGSWHARIAVAQVPLSTPDNVIMVLQSKKVRIELELVEEQVQQIHKLHARALSRISQYGRTGARLPDAERKVEWAKLQREVAGYEANALELLIPQQRKRLDQIVLQIQSRSKETGAGLLHNRMAEELKLSPEQSSIIKKKTAEEEAELKQRLDALNKEMAALKETARASVLSTLTPEQRAKHQDLLGQPFEVELPRSIEVTRLVP